MGENEEKDVEMEKANPREKEIKLCKGGLYDSSTRKSNSKEPFCLGISKSLHTALGQKGESKASQTRGAGVSYYKYWCIGYSVPVNEEEFEKLGQPAACLGLELILRRWSIHPPAHVQRKQEVHSAHSRSEEPSSSVEPSTSPSDNFQKRFARNAEVVASGVGRSAIRVGNHIKNRLINVIYPNQKRDD